jgi:uncharacterized damage-inducible protein DinB
MDRRDISTLIGYDRWATELQLSAARSVPEAHYQAFLDSPLGGLHATLVHILAAQRVWLARWRRETPPELIPPTEVPSLDALAALWMELWVEQDAFLDSVTDAGLAASVPYADRDGRTYAPALVHQIQHMVNHSTYHRGEVFLMLWRLGVDPPNIDLIAYHRGPEA